MTGHSKHKSFVRIDQVRISRNWPRHGFFKETGSEDRHRYAANGRFARKFALELERNFKRERHRIDPEASIAGTTVTVYD